MFDRRGIILGVILLLFAGLWYHWLLNPTLAFAASRRVIFMLGLVPVIAACVIVAAQDRIRFLPIAVVSCTMIWALRSALHPLSPDVSFHVGKVLWAANGRNLIDPVMGIPSGYPAAFHWLWGHIARWTDSDPMSLLRFVSVFNLVGLWLVVWLIVRHMTNNTTASIALYVASLTLFAKDISEVLFASPGSFSMPFAVLGWYLWVVPTRPIASVLGAFSLGLSILIWPTHLFGAVGVGLVETWSRRSDPKAWIYLVLALLSVGAVKLMRSVVPSGESWSGLQLLPPEIVDFVLGRFAVFASLGTQYYGWIPGLAGAFLLACFLILSWIGWRSNSKSRASREFTRLSLGIFIGALLSGWFLVTGSHMVRLEFVAGMALVPLAAAGLLSMWNSRQLGRLLSSPRIWRSLLACVWLLPFLVAVSASTERLNQWHTRSKEVSQYLATKTSSGDRVWASPATYRSVILGKLPLFGFLAHDWPLYFGAPRSEAQGYADSYEKILLAPTADAALTELIRNDVRWVLIDALEQRLPSWFPPNNPRIVSDTTLNSYTLLRVVSQR